MNIPEIIELKHKRETYGHDERAINKHSIRIFQVKRTGVKEPVEFILNKTLDGCPPFYSLYFYKPASSLPTMMKIEDKEYWGSGLSWVKAEAMAFKVISELLIGKKRTL